MILRILVVFDQPYLRNASDWSILEWIDSHLAILDKDDEIRILNLSSWYIFMMSPIRNSISIFCRHFTHHIWYVNWYDVTHHDALIVCHMNLFELEFCTFCKLETGCYIHDHAGIWQATFFKSYSNEILYFSSVTLD